MSPTLRIIIIFFLIPFGGFTQYFQQDVRYTIRVSLDDKKHLLLGDERIVYKNNSKDELTELFFHLWPAAYKDENTALAEQYFDIGDNRFLDPKPGWLGDIDSLNFHVNDEKVQWNILDDHLDVCRIKLISPLKPGDSITISTPFRVSIPHSYMSRLGHYKQAYYITQWYPKPAVYDKNGWNYFSYLDKGEFYSEFGSFDVYITLPENYKVAATGMMVDGNEEKQWIKRQDSITRSYASIPLSDSFPPSSGKTKTIHFQQSNIHDFAWFADKRWNVLSDTMKLESGKTIEVHSFFHGKNSTNWKRANEFMKNAIRHFSFEVGEYPYDAVTAIDAEAADGNGMEYPMITALNSSGGVKSFEALVVHEVGHNWFYGILGSNERCFGWMDEGLDKYIEVRYTSERYPADSTRLAVRLTRKNIQRWESWGMKATDRLLFNYLASARTNEDQSPGICAEQYNLKVYSPIIYHKPTLSLNYLRAYLGDSLTRLCFRNYFQEWKFRHPSPADTKESFEKTSGKKLDWLFDDLMMSRKKLDYRIKHATKKSDGYEVTVQNKGDIISPIHISALKNDSIVYDVWAEGFEKKMNFNIPAANADRIMIDHEKVMPEIYFSNNSIRTDGLLKKTEKVQLAFGTSAEHPGKSYIYYSPVAGWNNYNGFMAGAVLHNISFLEKKFEYRLMPMYAFGTSDIAGGGDIAYHIYPSGKIYRISLEMGLSHYAFGDDEYIYPDESVYTGILKFTKSDLRIILSLREKEENKNIFNTITFRNINIMRDLPFLYNYAEKEESINYYQAEYQNLNINPLERGYNKISITGNSDLLQVSGETKKFFNYNSRKKGFEARIYAGYLNMQESITPGMEHRMNLSGKRGIDDYLFDEVYLGRSEGTGLLAHQFTTDYAGFRTPTSFYELGEHWMTGLNVSTTLPGILPFRLFANVGTYDDKLNKDRTGYLTWELGVDLPLIKDIFIISLPFAYSDDIKYALEEQGLNGLEAIRFELRLKKLNPLDFIKNYYR